MLIKNLIQNFTWLVSIMYFTNIYSQTIAWNSNGSVTVTGGSFTFTSYVTDNVNDPSNMKYFDFSSLYKGFYNEGGIFIDNLQSNGSAEYRMFLFDKNNPSGNYKGVQVFGVKGNMVGYNSTPLENVSWSHNKWSKKNPTNSKNIKKISQNLDVFFPNNTTLPCDFSNVYQGRKKKLVSIGTMFAGLGLEVIGGAISVAGVAGSAFTGGASLGITAEGLATIAAGEVLYNTGYNGIFNQEEINNKCMNFFMPNQPVIIELKVQNATVGSLELPGGNSKRSFPTPREVFSSNDLLSVRWKNSNDETAVFLDGKSGTEQILIQSNQTTPTTWIDNHNIRLEVWGKMLSRNEDYTDPETDITEPSTSPEINTNYDYGLWVAGDLVSEDFMMFPKESWADYVFDKKYKLTDLKEIENYIKNNGHLPGIPSQKEIASGYQQHEINVKFLEKIEELTLYRINFKNESEKISKAIELQNEVINTIKEKYKNLLNDNN